MPGRGARRPQVARRPDLTSLFARRTIHTVKGKGVGPLGVHGRISALVQSGWLVLLSKDKLTISGP